MRSLGPDERRAVAGGRGEGDDRTIANRRGAEGSAGGTAAMTRLIVVAL